MKHSAIRRSWVVADGLRFFLAGWRRRRVLGVPVPSALVQCGQEEGAEPRVGLRPFPARMLSCLSGEAWAFSGLRAFMHIMAVVVCDKTSIGGGFARKAQV